MTNKAIAGLLKLTSALLEIHDENPFKIRTYTNAVYKVENLEEQLFGKNISELESLDGIGKSLAKSIQSIFETGTFDLLEEMKSITPPGILDMIALKGIGPKKIRTIWKELGIENTDALYDACLSGKIAGLKGFGIKTQEAIKENLEYLISQRGMVHFADAEPLAEKLLGIIRPHLTDEDRVSLTGEMRRKTEIVQCIEVLVTNKNRQILRQALEKSGIVELNFRESGPFSLRGKFLKEELNWLIRLVNEDEFEGKLMIYTGSGNHLSKVIKDNINLYSYLMEQPILSESKAYEVFGIPYIHPELREGSFELNYSNGDALTGLLEFEDLKGPFHNHSNYSDGKNTIRELAEYCMAQGFEYLGLSDHSKSAFYANGLREFDIKKQHEEIDILNKEFAPFTIFKGIESDILSDGSLDYEKDVLASFDFIVASVHSNLNMDRDKATSRLLKAIENPYTTILGHPTGRLLLRRQGYPIDHKKVIDACAENKVIIEINANPWRLDLDWRWVHYALEKEVILSINPDAHEIEGFNDMRYGVFIGRKGGLTKEMTFNTWSLDKVKKYLADRKANI
jgi:DNA polymerase (family 10)